jgi:GTPase SAR1 family protein
MANINYANREITAKVVYYGPSLSGKTANLQYLCRHIPAEKRGKLLSLESEQDRTIFFDLLPVDVGAVNGFQVRMQLFTVPGSIKYDETRKISGLTSSILTPFPWSSNTTNRTSTIWPLWKISTTD